MSEVIKMPSMYETVKSEEEQKHLLQFTGNWFIDVGILGFVNLMEEVYGWDFKTLQKKINEDKEKVYCSYFPFAYFYKWLSDRNQKVNPKLIEKLKEELEKKKFQDNKDLFDFVWFTFICNLFKELWIRKRSELIYQNEAFTKRGKLKKQYYYKNTKIYLQKIGERENIINEILSKHQNEIEKILKVKKDLNKLKYENLEKLLNSNDESISQELKKLIELLKVKHEEIKKFLNEEWENNVINQQKFTGEESLFYRIPIDSGFYKNFLFFNNYVGNLEQKNSFYNAICSNLDEEEMLKKIDKSVNKFLSSEEEFPNINYTELSTKEFKKQIEYLFVYLLCFTYAFEKYENFGYMTFYSNDLEFSYIINKRLKLYKKKIEESRNPNLIFKVTWQQIIDSLVEYKSSWSLENMYIISYQRLDNQTQENVEYIGIPKLQASILLDDTIRENLNNSIQFRSEKFEGNKYCWLLKEFIKGKPLYPIILSHINLALNEERVPNLSTCLYSLILEANISEFKAEKEKQNGNLFSENYFDNYKSLINEIKEDVRFTSFGAGLINQISKDVDTKKRIARELFNALKAKDKNLFLNILLKNMNENKNLCSNTNLNNWIFNKIIKNNISFEMYGLILTMNLLRGRKNE